MEEIKEINKSQNFDELLDLNDLMSNYKIYDNLKNNLTGYVETYFKSFFKTKDEVLSYIPEAKQHEYKKNLMFYCPGISKIKEMSFSTYLDNVMDTYLRNEPFYVVDTINKRILPVLAGDYEKTSFEMIIEKDELRVTRTQFHKSRYGYSWHDGDVTRTYVSDTRNNTLKQITGSWH